MAVNPIASGQIHVRIEPEEVLTLVAEYRRLRMELQNRYAASRTPEGQQKHFKDIARKLRRMSNPSGANNQELSEDRSNPAADLMTVVEQLAIYGAYWGVACRVLLGLLEGHGDMHLWGSDAVAQDADDAVARIEKEAEIRLRATPPAGNRAEVVKPGNGERSLPMSIVDLATRLGFPDRKAKTILKSYDLQKFDGNRQLWTVSFDGMPPNHRRQIESK
jgi:hypothetical protein